MQKTNKSLHHYLRNTLLSCVLLLLAGCSKHISIQKPLDVSKANQSASTEFTVIKQGTYRFSFLFVRAKNRAEMEQQTEVWGNANQPGTAILTQLQVFSGDNLIFDKRLLTKGTNGAYTIFHEGRALFSEVRPIQTLYLVPGNYRVEFKTLSAAEPFANTESYVEVSYYNPKH